MSNDETFKFKSRANYVARMAEHNDIATNNDPYEVLKHL